MVALTHSVFLESDTLNGFPAQERIMTNELSSLIFPSAFFLVMETYTSKITAANTELNRIVNEIGQIRH
jgi:hypothetical protein